MRIRKKQASATSDFEQFLKAYNCTYHVEKDKSATTYNFEFQAAQFVATIRSQNDCVEITYPCMSVVGIDYLDLVRSKCNERNNSNILFKFTYSIDHEENRLNVHLSFFNNSVTPELIAHELGAAFHFQREWQRDLDSAIDDSKDTKNHDLESDLYKYQREMFLLRRMEMGQQLDGLTANIASSTKALPLWQALETVAPLPAAHLLFMTVNTVNGQQQLKNEDEIRNFDLRSALVDGQGKQARLTRDYALLDLHYTQGEDQQPLMTTIALTAEGEDDHSIYTRVTITHPMRNASRRNSLSNEKRQPMSTSMLIALDRSDDHQRQQEFEYMWSDARLKAQGKEKDNLSDDQKMLCQVNNADEAYNLYWGQRMFNNGRYYEAILYLENLFNSYRGDFFEMSAERKHMFIEVAYKLGFCYNELGLYKQAFYYLDLMASDGNIRHTMELVNALANSKDMRLFSYTEGIMEEVKRNFENNDELPDNIKDFINFLRRRRGYAFIDFNDLDKAERIFTAMLDEEENSDYAIIGLATIKKLREQRDKGISPQEPEANK